MLSVCIDYFSKRKDTEIAGSINLACSPWLIFKRLMKVRA
jgi:hypothetical protein